MTNLQNILARLVDNPEGKEFWAIIAGAISSITVVVIQIGKFILNVLTRKNKAKNEDLKTEADVLAVVTQANKTLAESLTSRVEALDIKLTEWQDKYQKLFDDHNALKVEHDHLQVEVVKLEDKSKRLLEGVKILIAQLKSLGVNPKWNLPDDMEE